MTTTSAFCLVKYVYSMQESRKGIFICNLSQSLQYLFMISQKIGLILISGIPASGKTYFSRKLCQKLIQNNFSCKIFSTDNLQAYIGSVSQNLEFEALKFCQQKDWQTKLNKYYLNKQRFNDQIWKKSRQYVENPDFLASLLLNCQILIIQDELPLRSQRKPFKRYCSDNKMRFLEIQLSVPLEQALKNNRKRGQIDSYSKVPDETIKKSMSKFQHSQSSMVITNQQFQTIIEETDFVKEMKYVTIQDNYSEYLKKKSKKHEFTQNQLEENQLRTLISKIIKEDGLSLEYFGQKLDKKQKADALAQCKKLYIQHKRKVPFKKVVQDFMLKRQEIKNNTLQ